MKWFFGNMPEAVLYWAIGRMMRGARKDFAVRL